MRRDDDVRILIEGDDASAASNDFGAVAARTERRIEVESAGAHVECIDCGAEQDGDVWGFNKARAPW